MSGWCFTCNNWTDLNYNEFMGINCRYIVIGKEVGEKGTPHLQGYIYFNSNYGHARVRKMLLGCHVIKARGNAEENKVYCSKGNDWQERGEIPIQGKRVDLGAFRDAILAGASKETLWQDYCGHMARYPKMFTSLREEMMKKKANADYESGKRHKVVVLYGDAEAGKTYYIYNKHKADNVYKLEVGDGSAGSVWYCGYEAESILLIDDFQGCLKFRNFLKLLDNYPLRVQCKGGHTYRTVDKIYVTSNSPPSSWYPNMSGVWDRNALNRRIYKIFKVVRRQLYLQPNGPIIHEEEPEETSLTPDVESDNESCVA